MKLVSWNVNGLRSCIKKGFLNFLKSSKADVFCIQETKMQENQLTTDIQGYYKFWCSAEKKGYSGTLTLSKIRPISTFFDEYSNEGRIVALEYESFFLVNVYTPNSKRDLSRLSFRMKWEDDFKRYLLSFRKPVILCGDLNVAHEEIDLENPNSNRRNAGFTNEERKKFSCLLNAGFVDTFRYKYPDKKRAYTWWSNFNNSRQRNIGWRIDYFLTSGIDKEKIVDVKIHSEILGSDHCPVELLVDA